MMKWKVNELNEDVSKCPTYRTIELFQGKWTVRVLYQLSKHNVMRFGELKKAIPGISNTMLTATLKDLEEKSMVDRVQYNEIPPRVEYVATNATKELDLVFQAMGEWGNKYLCKEE